MSKLGKPMGALWIKTSAKGVEYLSGKIGDERVLVFKVRQKKSDKAPDFEIFKSESLEQRQARDGEPKW